MPYLMPPVWEKAEDGRPVSCVEKIKVLNQNYQELLEGVRDAIDDCVLMGGSEAQMRLALRNMVEAVEASF
jgi:hypothetical protein